MPPLPTCVLCSGAIRHVTVLAVQTPTAMARVMPMMTCPTTHYAGLTVMVMALTTCGRTTVPDWPETRPREICSDAPIVTVMAGPTRLMRSPMTAPNGRISMAMAMVTTGIGLTGTIPGTVPSSHWHRASGSRMLPLPIVARPCTEIVRCLLISVVPMQMEMAGLIMMIRNPISGPGGPTLMGMDG